MEVKRSNGENRACRHGFLFLVRFEKSGLNMFCSVCRHDVWAPVTWGCQPNFHMILDNTIGTDL